MSSDQRAEPATALDDPRLRFFLENREQLREWVAIADEVSDAVAEILRGIAPDVVAGLSEEPEVRTVEQIAGENQSGTVLHRPNWAVAGQAPFVGVSLAWDGRRVDPVGGWPGTQLPYVGVTTSHSTPEGKETEQILRAQIKETLQVPYGYLKGSYWVAYRPIQASSDWWQDVAGWREWVVSQLLDAWHQCAPVIDDAVGQLH